LKPSVTILLPVHNAQHRLETQVAEILDVLPELTNRFELMIIDDGSTDDSFELARHLAVKYPQVSTLRHSRRLGLEHAVRSGLEQTDGDLVLVGDEQHGVRADDLRRLWHRFAEQRQATEKTSQTSSSKSRVSTGQARWFEKVLKWKPAPAAPQAFDLDESRKQRQASEIARGINRRVDERENVAPRRATVQPVRLPSGGQSGSAPRGPIDRRQRS
jgi:Glycosyl transferase family 2